MPQLFISREIFIFHTWEYFDSKIPKKKKINFKHLHAKCNIFVYLFIIKKNLDYFVFFSYKYTINRVWPSWLRKIAIHGSAKNELHIIYLLISNTEIKHVSHIQSSLSIDVFLWLELQLLCVTICGCSYQYILFNISPCWTDILIYIVLSFKCGKKKFS